MSLPSNIIFLNDIRNGLSERFVVSHIFDLCMGLFSDLQRKVQTPSDSVGSLLSPCVRKALHLYKYITRYVMSISRKCIFLKVWTCCILEHLGIFYSSLTSINDQRVSVKKPRKGKKKKGRKQTDATLLISGHFWKKVGLSFWSVDSNLGTYSVPGGTYPFTLTETSKSVL